MADDVAEVRRRIDIVDLVGQRVTLKKAGKNWRGLCPFHNDRNPSFNVSQELGRYNCWSCGAKGDVFNWVMETQQVDFAEALRILAKQAGVTLSGRGEAKDKSRDERLEAAMADAQSFFVKQLQASDEAKKYIADRGIPTDVVAHWELGFGPGGDLLARQLQKQGHQLAECKEVFLVDKDPSGGYYDRFRHRLMFPIRDERGRLVAFGGRIIGAGEPKYINSSDTPLYSKSRVLYGLDKAKHTLAKTRTGILVEGYLDAIACHRAGVTGAVATLGTAMAEDHVRLIKKWCDRVVMLYDSDSAGQKAAERAADLLQAAGIGVRVAMMPQGEDPDTLLKTQGPAAVEKAVDAAMPAVEFRLWLLRQRVAVREDEFWTGAYAALATATDELEIERYAHELAGEYPGTKDRLAAKQAIKRQVASLRRGGSPTRTHRPGKVGAARAKTGLTGPEEAVFRAMLSPSTKQDAWQALGEAGLFVTGAAEDAAVSLRQTHQGQPPDGPAADWVPSLPEGPALDLMSSLFMDESAPTGSAVLADALARLRSLREERAAHEIVAKSGDLDDDALRDFHSRMQRLKDAETEENQGY
ncbi:MAG: DNA primase [Armatimonadetes bacterium]|nr:DNA primase [Armatimonadota bacterium]